MLIVVGLMAAVTGILLAVGVTVASTEVRSSALSPARFSAISSGVVLVETFDCDGNAIALGSGFLVGTSVVMTARHVLAKSCGIKVRGAGRVITAKRWVSWYGASIGTTKNADVATFKLDSPSAGHVFSFRASPLPIGANVAMAGHPLGNQIQLTQGPLLSREPVNGVPTIAVQLLGAEGASGSPFLDDSGDVVGILQKGSGATDDLGQRTGGHVFGLDLSGGGWEDDLCHSYPRGGIPDCEPPAAREPKPVAPKAKPGKPKPLACELKPYADCRNADLTGRKLIGADLHGAMLAGAQFGGARLDRANLYAVNLAGANLSGVNLTAANLRAANLSRADLSFAILRGANLDGTNLKGANLSSANLNEAAWKSTVCPDGQTTNIGCGNDGVSIPATPKPSVATAVASTCKIKPYTDCSGADLRAASLRGADLHGANLQDAVLSRAALSSANLFRANLLNANLRGAYLYEANLRGANLGGADLTSAGLGGANLTGADLDTANLTGASLDDATLRGANLAGANLTRASLANTDLRGAILTDANLTGVLWSGTTCPDGTVTDTGCAGNGKAISANPAPVPAKPKAAPAPLAELAIAEGWFATESSSDPAKKIFQAGAQQGKLFLIVRFNRKLDTSDPAAIAVRIVKPDGTVAWEDTSYPGSGNLSEWQAITVDFAGPGSVAPMGGGWTAEVSVDDSTSKTFGINVVRLPNPFALTLSPTTSFNPASTSSISLGWTLKQEVPLDDAFRAELVTPAGVIKDTETLGSVNSLVTGTASLSPGFCFSTCEYGQWTVNVRRNGVLIWSVALQATR